MIGFPIDSHVTFEANGIPVFDRAISSEPYRSLLHVLFTDGVLPNVSTNLQVTATTGTTLKVLKGFAMVNGCMKLQEQDMTLQIDTGESLPRIDRVVMRLDVNDNVRACELAVIKGTPASTPTAPDIVRSSSIYDISLATVRVNASTTTISNANITDTRFDKTVCGVISSLSQFDTDSLNQQLQAWEQEQQEEFENWSAEQQAEFAAWVDTIKNILDDSTAGHLQNEIDDIYQQLANITESAGGSRFKINFTFDTAGGATYSDCHYKLTLGETVREKDFSTTETSFEENGVLAVGTATLDVSYDFTIGGSKESKTLSMSVEVPYYGAFVFNAQVAGSFDFKKWLATIEKTADSLDEVLANEKLVRELMTRHISSDYLAENCKSEKDIQPFANSRVAVKWIGLRSYIYNKLMAIPKWQEALQASDYSAYITNSPDDNNSEWEFDEANGIEMVYDNGLEFKTLQYGSWYSSSAGSISNLASYFEKNQDYYVCKGTKVVNQMPFLCTNINLTPFKSANFGFEMTPVGDTSMNGIAQGGLNINNSTSSSSVYAHTTLASTSQSNKALDISNVNKTAYIGAGIYGYMSGTSVAPFNSAKLKHFYLKK